MLKYVNMVNTTNNRVRRWVKCSVCNEEFRACKAILCEDCKKEAYDHGYLSQEWISKHNGDLKEKEMDWDEI